jgi:Tol biopolymer transport system component
MWKRSCTLGLVSVAVFFASSAHAQYPFGKNKVIYQGKDWRVLETPHVDIYHYAPDSTLILYLAPLVEETFLEYTKTFRVEFRRRLPFVFYATHYDFQQTNILPVLISEYTGGFTDLMKGRIAVPFNGSYANLRHVVRHEMVHAFMLEKLQDTMHAHGKYTYSQPPLWFVEGMAEFFANAPANSQGDMFVRDALLNGRLLDLDEIWRIEGSFMMYKQGEAILNFIATNFGADAVVRILEGWWSAPEFTMVLSNTIDMDLWELNDAFMKYVKRRHYPAVMTHRFGTDQGVQLTPPRSFHSRPAAALEFGADSAGMERIVYSLTGKDGVVVLSRGRGSQRVTPASPGAHGVEGIANMPWTEDVVVKGGRSSELESLPAFRSKIEAHGDTLVFVSKSSARDRIYFWSAREGREIAHFEFEALAIIASPTVSGDRTKMVFSAIDTRGVADLYLVHLADGRLERLTEDGFSEDDPDYHPYEDAILFASDRGAGQDRDRTHIYRMDLETREIVPFEGGAFADANPEWAPDGRSFLFTSDRGGTPNIYLREGDTVVRQTDVVGGVSAPSFYPDGTGFVAVVYERGEFQLFDFPVRDGGGVPASARPPDDVTVPWTRANIPDSSFVTKPYETNFSIDFIGAGVAIDPEAGDIGNGGQLVMTDVLGNHQISFVFGTTTDDFSSFWDDFNAAFAYVNLSHRVNYSLSFFHLNSYSDPRFISRREKRVGGAFGVSYPFNKFERIESSIILRQIQQSDYATFVGTRASESYTGSLFMSYVKDNTVWTIGGPLMGWRYYVTSGATVDFLGRGYDNIIAQLDVRHYIKVSSRVAIALRYVTRNAWGGDEQLFYLGGPWTLRGYPYNEFFGRTTQLVNTEIRFPLLDGLRIVLPFGPIEFPMFRGALFFDAGTTSRNTFEIFDTPWLGTLGIGTELNLGFAPVLRVNFTWPTNFDTIANDTGFELFIGYNY